MKHYKNIYMPVTYEIDIDRRIDARGVECDTITEAKKMVKSNGYGFAIRAYLGDDGTIVGWRVID